MSDRSLGEMFVVRSLRSLGMGDFLGIPGYVPEWWSDPGAFMAQHEVALASLLGADLAEGWVLWDPAEDDHFADAPVILDFSGGQRVEVCCNKFDQLSVTFGTIDVTRTVAKAWAPGELEWRSDVLPDLLSVLGETLRSVSTIEIAFAFDGAQEIWCLGGLQFGIGTTPGLAIFNGLDETQVSIDLRPTDGWRTRAWLAT